MNNAAIDGKWENDIAAFEAADRIDPPPKDAIVFVGSSSIRLWKTLSDDFSGLPVINRGFGGSCMHDTLRYADRIVIPYRPRHVVVYAGDNDIAFGGTPERVAESFRKFSDKVFAELPSAKITCLAMKLCASRWGKADLFKEGNRLIREFVQTDDRLSFADTATPLLGADGMPDPVFFREDRLHLSPRGYAEWVRIVAPLLR